MVKSIHKVLGCWAAGLLVFTLVAATVSYFLTEYRVTKLNDTLQSQYKQLQQPINRVPEPNGAPLPKIQTVDVSSLLTQAAKQQNVDIHYQQSSEHAGQWLVGVSGSYQSTTRFVASIVQAQQGSLQAFPFTQTLKWQDTDQQSGKLSWQFLWLTANESAPPELSTNPLFKSDFPTVLAEPLQCLSKPDIQSDIQIVDWSSVQLVATQTSPLKKALLKIPGQPLLTLTSNNWIATPLMQLKEIRRGYIEFQHWQKEAGCWSAQSLKLSLTKDNNPQ